MFQRRRTDDRVERSAYIKVSRGDEELFVGEISPGHAITLRDGLRIEYLWTREHHPPERTAPR